MQKKLIAVAVAGALGIPAVAMAQTSTVNVYGVFYAEYARINQGNNLAGAPLVTYDHLQNPGSAIGFRGEEKLGGNMSAWFQCESTADFRGQSNEGLCSRNSALGLKGGFGNVFTGVWDTPFKKVQDNVGAGDTGVYGNAGIFMGNSTTVNSGAASQGVFKRRQRNSVNYDSPSFGGFQVMGAFSTLNTQSATLSSATGNKPRIYSLAVAYKNGPINVFGAYEQHKDVTGAAAAGDDDGYVLGGSYRFRNNLKLGAMYSRQKWEGGTNVAPTESRVNTWHLGMDWMFAGPHGVRAAYSKAGDVKGNGAAIAVRPAAGASTSANQWQIRYVYAMSKRTEFTAGYSKVNNSSNSRYQIGGTSANGFGQDQSAFALGLRHTF